MRRLALIVSLAIFLCSSVLHAQETNLALLTRCIDSSAVINNSVRAEINRAKQSALLFADALFADCKGHSHDSVLYYVRQLDAESAIQKAAAASDIDPFHQFQLFARLSVLRVELLAAQDYYEQTLKYSQGGSYDNLMEYSLFCRFSFLDHKALELAQRALQAADGPLQECRARLNIAYILCNMGEPDKALSELTSIQGMRIKKKPRDLDPSINMLVGMAYSQKDEPDMAMLYYTDALNSYRKMKDVLVPPQYILRELCNIYSVKGEYQKSIQCLNEALSYTKQYNNPINRDLARSQIYLQWGVLLKNMGAYNFAREKFQISLQTISRIVMRNRNYISDLAEIETLQAALDIEMKDYLHAEALCEDAYRIYNSCKYSYSSEAMSGKATLLRTFGDLYTAMGRYNDAQQKYQQALEVYNMLTRSSNRVYKADMAVVLNRMGLMYAEMGDFNNAISYYKVAASNLGTIYESHQRYIADYANTLANIGNLYSRYDMEDSALTYLQRGLQVFRGKQELNDIEKMNYSNICNNLAILYRKRGNLAIAEPFYESAYQTRKILSAKSDIYMPLWADILNNYGLYYVDANDYDLAEYYLEQALEVREKYATDNTVANRLAIADNHDNLAYVESLVHRNDEAAYHYQKSSDIRAKLAAQNPQLYIADYIQSLENLASQYRIMNSNVEAIVALTEMVEALEYVDKLPNSDYYLEKRADAYHNLSILCYVMGNKNQALQSIRKSIDGYRYLANTVNRQLYLPDVADALNQAGNYCVDLENYNDAEHYYREALRIMSVEYANRSVPAYTVAGMYNNLGLLYYNQQRMAEAKDCYVRAKDILDNDSESGVDMASILNSAITNINIAQYIIYEVNSGVADSKISDCDRYLDETTALLKPYLANSSANYYYNYAMELKNNIIK